MSSEKQGSQAIRIALQTEHDGLELYTRAAGITTSSAGKAMFEMLIAEEKKHVRIIERVAAGQGYAEVLKEAGPRESEKVIKTIFSEAKAHVSEKVPASTGEKEAVQMGMDFEKKGYQFYEKAAAEAQNPNEKGLFDSLAKWEDEHYAILERAMNYLNDTGHWFLWEEGGPIEG